MGSIVNKKKFLKHFIIDSGTICVPLTNKEALLQCFETQLRKSPTSLQFILACTQNNQFSCNENTLNSFDSCLLQRARGMSNVIPTTTTVCLRRSITTSMIDCLRVRHTGVKNILPLEAGPVVG